MSRSGQRRFAGLRTWVFVAALAHGGDGMASSARPRALFILAHPDDETMVGGLIERLQERDIEISIAYATEGEGGDVHVPWLNDLRAFPTPTPIMRALRRVESAMAMAIVKPVHVYWLHQPDTGYTTHRGDFAQSRSWSADKIRQQVRIIAHNTKAEFVVVPGQQAQAHAHHKYIAFVVTEMHHRGMLAQVKQVYEFDETGWLDSKPGPGDIVLPRRDTNARGQPYSDFQGRLSQCYFTQGPAHLRWLKPKQYDAAEVLRPIGVSALDPLRAILAIAPLRQTP